MFNQFSYFVLIYIVSFSNMDIKCADDKTSINDNCFKKVSADKAGTDNASSENVTVNDPTLKNDP